MIRVGRESLDTATGDEVFFFFFCRKGKLEPEISFPD